MRTRPARTSSARRGRPDALITKSGGRRVQKEAVWPAIARAVLDCATMAAGAGARGALRAAVRTCGADTAGGAAGWREAAAGADKRATCWRGAAFGAATRASCGVRATAGLGSGRATAVA